MALIANLAVALTAQTGQFAAKMQGASKAVDTFASRAQAAQKRVLDFAKTYAIPLAAATALVAVVRASVAAIEANLNLAEKLEATYNQMKTLRVAADMAGGSIEDMTGAVEELQKRLGEGGKSTSDALGKIGLTTSGLMGKGAYQQILLVSEGLKTLTSSEVRAAVAADLFGKKSKSLINLFMSGSEGIKAAEGYVKRTGQAMSDAQANGVRVMKDGLDELWDTTKGLGEQFTLFVSGPLTLLLKSVNSLYQILVAIPRAYNAINEGLGNMIKAGPSMEESYLKIAITMSSIVGDMETANALAADLGEMKAARQYGNTDDGKLKGFEQKRVADVAVIERAKTQAAWDGVLSNAKARLGLAWMSVQDIMAKGAKAAAAKQAAESAASAKGFAILRMGISAQWEALKYSVGTILDKAYEETMRKQEMIDAQLYDLFQTSGPGTSSNPANSRTAAENIGTRGTFASANAGRGVGAFSIEKEQLEEQRQTNKTLDKIANNIGTVQ